MGSYTATAFGTKMAKIQANIGLNPLEHRHRYANEYGILLIKIYLSSFTECGGRGAPGTAPARGLVLVSCVRCSIHQQQSSIQQQQSPAPVLS